MRDRNPTGRPLRILMMAPQYRPLVGGYERAAERLSAALVGRGHRVTVITDRRDLSWARHEIHQGVAIRRLWCVFRPGVHLPTSLLSLTLFLLLHGRRFDVWHVHQYGLRAVVMIGLGLLLDRPVVLKLTSSAEQGIAKAVVEQPLGGLAAGLLKRVSAVVALTRETTREALLVGIPATRVHQLGNGVDTEAYRPASNEDRLGLKRELGILDRHAVIYVGRLSSEKNTDGLLQAWIDARKSLPNGWTLVLVGDGPARAKLESQISDAGVADSVMVAGQQPNVEQWMAAADIYVSSSLFEGLSNTLLEAMACGLPVAVTRVSGVKELVEERGAGLTVNVGDNAALASALVRLAQDSDLRERLGAAARLAIEQTYSLQAVADGHESLYRRLIAERTS